MTPIYIGNNIENEELLPLKACPFTLMVFLGPLGSFRVSYAVGGAWQYFNITLLHMNGVSKPSLLLSDAFLASRGYFCDAIVISNGKSDGRNI